MLILKLYRIYELSDRPVVTLSGDLQNQTVLAPAPITEKQNLFTTVADAEDCILQILLPELSTGRCFTVLPIYSCDQL